MVRSCPRITDLVSQLGLRAPFTKRGVDWKLSEAAPVHDMYLKDIDQLCKTHCVKDNDEILYGKQVRQAALTLSNQYGPMIWTSAEARPWLLQPGEGARSAPYERDLYWDVPSDRDFIRDTLSTIVVEKIWRYRKEHIRKMTDDSTDPSYTSTAPVSTSRSTRTSLAPGPTTLQCFTETSGIDGHYNASWLKENGIWLGDMHHDDRAINGPCFDDVCQNYLDMTFGDEGKGQEEPYMFDEVPNERLMMLECAACQAFNSKSSPAGLVQVRCEGITYEDPDNQTVLQKNLWMFSCRLNGKEVFALIRRDKKNPEYWSFWKVDGGYSTKVYLTTTSKYQASTLAKGKGRSVVPDASDYEGAAKRRRADSGHTTIGPKPAAGEARGGTIFQATNMRDVSRNQSISEPIIAESLFASLMSAARDQRSASAGPASLRQFLENKHEFDSMHDATPASASRSAPSDNRASNITAAVQHEPQRAVAEPATESAKATLSSFQSTPNGSERIRIWLAADWTAGRNVVVVDHTTSIQELYTDISKKLARKLQGKSIAALNMSVRMPPHGKEAIDVEIDDEAGWETMLELAGEAGTSELSAIVLRNEDD